MRKLLPILFFFFIKSTTSQVVIILDSVPKYFTPLLDTVYLTINRNNATTTIPFKMVNNKLQLSLQKDTGSFRFVVSRGDSTTMECEPYGQKSKSRVYSFIEDADTLHISVAAWSDWKYKQRSITGNVNLLKTNFYSKQLNRNVRIWIRFPMDYDLSSKRYPVLYMHDGQELFDGTILTNGEWGIDETLALLENERDSGLIVVGIEGINKQSIIEYSPWPNSSNAGGKGIEYANFVVATLKPLIDQHFRTKPDRNNTGVAGSFFGAQISIYMALQFPDVFSKCALFSPALKNSETAFEFPRMVGVKPESRFFLICGAQEGNNTAWNMNRMKDSLLANGGLQSEVICLIKPDGQSNEWFWKREFGDAYKFLFYGRLPGNFENDFPDSKELTVSPIPAKDFLIVNYTFRLSERFRIVMNNESGLDFTFDPSLIKNLGDKKLLLDISKLEVGPYYVVFINDRKTYYRRFVKQ